MTGLRLGSKMGPGGDISGNVSSQNRSYDLNVSGEAAMINRQAAVTSPTGTLPRVLKKPRVLKRPSKIASVKSGNARNVSSRNQSYDLNVSSEVAMIDRQAAVTSPKGTLPRVLKSGKNARNVSSRNRSYDLNVSASAETAMINRQAVVAPPMGTLPRVLRRPINAETPRFERSISPLRSMPKLNFESDNKIHSEFEKTLKTLKSSLKSKPNDETEIDECNCCTSEVYYDKEKSSSFEGRSFSNPIGKRHIFSEYIQGV